MRALCVSLIATVSWPARADVMMEAFFLNIPSGGASPWYWDWLGGNANSLRKAGITAVWIPPVLKGASGGYSAGYDPFDDYDIGSKDQKGTVPTRYGNRDQLARCVAMLRANGINVYVDTVHNHRAGDDGQFSFRYKDAYGNPGAGRFQKGRYDFHPNVPQDPDVPDGNGEMSFGRDLAHINGAGRWVYNELLKSSDWLTKALGIQGYRLDYVKGISTQWMRACLNYGAMQGKFAVGEFWDGDVNRLRWWISQVENRSSAFDFPLRFLLKQMCDFPDSFNMGALDHAGLAGADPLHAVTFVENHDLDRDERKIFNRKALAYAYILTSEGYPCIFHKDYFVYGLKPEIDNLVWIHEKLAAGGTVQRWKSAKVFAYERLGGPHLLVGLNNDLNSAQTITVNTGLGPNVQLHDYTGHAGDVWTDGAGKATLTIPANRTGHGFFCYSRTGQSGTLPVPNYAVTQEFAGADDLDIQPADNTRMVQAAKVYAAAGQTVTGSLYCDTTDWTDATSISLEAQNPAGAVLNTAYYNAGTPPGSGPSFVAPTTGWYTFRIGSSSTPDTNPRPRYWLKVNYTAPQKFAESRIDDSVDVSLYDITQISDDTFDLTFAVTNLSFDDIAGPIQLAVTNLPAGVRVANPSGQTWDDLPYVGGARTPLAPGDVALIVLRLQNIASPESLTYTLQPYARVF